MRAFLAGGSPGGPWSAAGALLGLMAALIFVGCAVIVLRCKDINHRRTIWSFLVASLMEAVQRCSILLNDYNRSFSEASKMFRVVAGMTQLAAASVVACSLGGIILTLRLSRRREACATAEDEAYAAEQAAKRQEIFLLSREAQAVGGQRAKAG